MGPRNKVSMFVVGVLVSLALVGCSKSEPVATNAGNNASSTTSAGGGSKGQVTPAACIEMAEAVLKVTATGSKSDADKLKSYNPPSDVSAAIDALVGAGGVKTSDAMAKNADKIGAWVDGLCGDDKKSTDTKASSGGADTKKPTDTKATSSTASSDSTEKSGSDASTPKTGSLTPADCLRITPAVLKVTVSGSEPDAATLKSFNPPADVVAAIDALVSNGGVKISDEMSKNADTIGDWVDQVCDEN